MGPPGKISGSEENGGGNHGQAGERPITREVLDYPLSELSLRPSGDVKLQT